MSGPQLYIPVLVREGSLNKDHWQRDQISFHRNSLQRLLQHHQKHQGSVPASSGIPLYESVYILHFFGHPPQILLRSNSICEKEEVLWNERGLDLTVQYTQ